MVAKFLPSLSEPKQINTHLTVRYNEIAYKSLPQMPSISQYYMLQHTFKKISDDRLNKLVKNESTLEKFMSISKKLSFRKKKCNKNNFGLQHIKFQD